MTPTIWHGCYESRWQGVITPASMAHPAKFSRDLIERIYDHCLQQGWLRKEELKNTIELEKYSVEMLRNATDGHKEGCICWTCTVMRDIDRDLTRIQKLMENH